jgi:hypothetical protein
MKKITIIFLTLLALTLSACSSAATATPTGFTGQGDPGTGTLPPSMELLIGTLKLDGTAQAITTEQAKALLPLWQVYQDLSSSDNAAQAEIDALMEQIQGTLTSEQMQAITDMKLTRQEMFTSMQELGITTGRQPGTSGGGNNGFTPGQDGERGGFQPARRRTEPFARPDRHRAGSPVTGWRRRIQLQQHPARPVRRAHPIPGESCRQLTCHRQTWYTRKRNA